MNTSTEKKEKAVLQRRLWLPWFVKKGDKEIRLSSEDVYAALQRGRQAIFYIIQAKNKVDDERLEDERQMDIIQVVEDGLRSMFGQALKETPKLMIPGKKHDG
jgi:hypothetical protein